LALLAFGDQPKPGAEQALSALRGRGLQLALISGDNQAAAQAMGQRLGLQAEEIHAEVLPAQKTEWVRRLQEQAHALGKTVVFVGDGINDAPALAAADVGMAMANPDGGGTDVAMGTAGITLMRGDVALVAQAIDLSSRTVSKIRQNLFWAFAYNIAGIPLAALGYLSPVRRHGAEFGQRHDQCPVAAPNAIKPSHQPWSLREKMKGLNRRDHPPPECKGVGHGAPI
jgi:Cu+-exporting ATPase